MKITMCLVRTCLKTLRNVYMTFFEKMLWLIKNLLKKLELLLVSHKKKYFKIVIELKAQFSDSFFRRHF